MYKLKRRGEIGSPCGTPLLIGIVSPNSFAILILKDALLSHLALIKFY